MLEYSEIYSKIIKGLNILYQKNALIIDTETTGFTKKDEIIDFAAVSFQTGQVLFQQYYLPQTKINPHACAVHNLTFNKLLQLGAIPITQSLKKLNLILCSEYPIITFNASFDKRLIQQTLEKYNKQISMTEKWHCAMQACKMIYGKKLKLEDICRKLSLESGDHTAVGDCLATRRVLLNLMKHGNN